MFKDSLFWACMAIGAVPGAAEAAEGFAAYPAAALIDGAIITLIDGGILYAGAAAVRRAMEKSKQKKMALNPPRAEPLPEDPGQASP